MIILYRNSTHHIITTNLTTPEPDNKTFSIITNKNSTIIRDTIHKVLENQKLLEDDIIFQEAQKKKITHKIQIVPKLYLRKQGETCTSIHTNTPTRTSKELAEKIQDGLIEVLL